MATFTLEIETFRLYANILEARESLVLKGGNASLIEACDHDLWKLANTLAQYLVVRSTTTLVEPIVLEAASDDGWETITAENEKEILAELGHGLADESLKVN